MLAQRTGPEFTVFGNVITFRTPWAIAAVVALAITAVEVAPRSAVSGRELVWYANALILVVAAVGSILLHEASHAAVSRRIGRATERISIYPLGGVADDFNDPGTPLEQTYIAIAGPIASAIIGSLLLLAMTVVPTRATPLHDDLLFLGAGNLLLAGINLLPGYPLDGGRVFRSLVWYLHDDFATGTRASVTYGQIISTFGLASGLVILGSRESWSSIGIWIILASWGVARIGRHEVIRCVLLADGGSLTAGDAVRGLNPHVRADQPLDEVLESLLAEMRSGPGLVTENGDVIGVIALRGLHRYRRSDWSRTTAREAMIPVSDLSELDESVSVRRLLNVLTEGHSETLLVIGQNGVVGALDRQIAIEKLLDRVQVARSMRR